MGGTSSKKYVSDSELSLDESDSEWFQDTTKIASKMNLEDTDEQRTDAALRNITLPSSQTIILERVPDIQKELDDYELVSLVYLLYDTCELALQDLLLLLKVGNNPDLLFKWAQSESLNGTRWQSKLIEALCIIQNYKVLKNFGYNKSDLNERYMPHRAETSCFVNKTRKALYLVAEKLDQNQSLKFIENMTRKFQELGIPVCNYGEAYFLELYFLYWEQNHVNIEVIKQTLKVMDLEQHCDLLSYAITMDNSQESINTYNEIPSDIPTKMVKKDVKTKTRRKSTTQDNTYFLQPRSLEDSGVSPIPGSSGISRISRESLNQELQRYPINKDNPGILLIINQEEFFTEPDPKYKDLLHEDNDIIQLEQRRGTRMDKIKLENVFRRRGFKIDIKDNLAHFQILETIKEVVMSISEESSLIVCILSHGDNGVVYGANSCKVDVNEIQNIMCKKNKKLIGRPKVLILQSCQGKQCQQRIEEESTDDEDHEQENTKDGLSTVPTTADLLTFWATIPGYAAIRNINRGSWFVQELCNEMELTSSIHFMDICTNVVRRVTSKAWKEQTGTNIMTPMLQSTLRKAFYLPLPKKNTEPKVDVMSFNY